MSDRTCRAVCRLSCCLQAHVAPLARVSGASLAVFRGGAAFRGARRLLRVASGRGRLAMGELGVGPRRWPFGPRIEPTTSPCPVGPRPSRWQRAQKVHPTGFRDQEGAPMARGSQAGLRWLQDGPRGPQEPSQTVANASKKTSTMRKSRIAQWIVSIGLGLCSFSGLWRPKAAQ